MRRSIEVKAGLERTAPAQTTSRLKPLRRLALNLLGSTLLTGLLLACAGAAPQAQPASSPKARATAAAPAAVVPPEPQRTLTQLRTGSVPPSVVSEPIVGKLTGYVRTKTTETFRVEIPAISVPGSTPWVVFEGSPWPGPFSFLEVDGNSMVGPPARTLWLRRPVSDGSDKAKSVALNATLLVLGNTKRDPAQQLQVRVPDSKLGASNATLTIAYQQALARALASTPLGALFEKQAQDNQAWTDVYPSADWASLMRMTTGYDSVASALRAHEQLRLTTDPKQASIAIETLQAPELPSHPWAQMLAALPQKNNGLSEPLALATPADFYFVRAQHFGALQALLDELDVWLTNGIHFAEGGGRYYGLVQRYRAQLGLSPSDLTRILGPQLISDLALVGSDPFVRQGSDISLLIRPKDAQGLSNALLAKLRLDHPAGVQQTSFNHGGVEVLERTTPDHVLRQYYAHVPGVAAVGPLVVVSNSKGAVQRILDTLAGKRPALSSELDFKYMLQRDADVSGDILCYVGDRFVRGALAAPQRVLDARRQLARAELSRAGYAALLFGWIEGREPQTLAELKNSPWLNTNPLQHSNKEEIKFELGQSPRSSWGTPAFLTPLIDLPALTRVTQQERDAYQQFVQSYQWQWSERVDPIAARFKVDASTGHFESHVRVLPVVNSSDYRQLWRAAGAGQVQTQSLFPGAFFTLAIGEDSELRRELSGQSRNFLGQNFELDWLGDWLTLGVADEPALAELLRQSGGAPEPPLAERENIGFEKILADLPAFLVVDLRNPGTAAVAVTALRKLAEGSVPDLLTWKQLEKHNGTTLVEVAVEEVRIYYALTKRRLYVTLQQPVLRALLDADVGTKPMALKASPGQGSQFVVDVQRRNPSGMLQALAWFFEQEVRERMSNDAEEAELLLRGTPQLTPEARQQLAMRYFGSYPVTPEGGNFQLTPQGVTDPLRGSIYAPKFEAVPATGSPLKALLDLLASAHIETAFDTEPGTTEERSLRTKLILKRQKAANP